MDGEVPDRHAKFGGRNLYRFRYECKSLSSLNSCGASELKYITGETPPHWQEGSPYSQVSGYASGICATNIGEDDLISIHAFEGLVRRVIDVHNKRHELYPLGAAVPVIVSKWFPWEDL